MSRTPRLVVDDGTYHVMNRGAGRCAIFNSDSDRVEFGRLLGEIHERFGVVVDAYCLMGNHFHLVLQAPGRNLSTAMQHLSSVYTQHFNERSGRDGPLFRGRFRSLVIDSHEYFLQAVRYVHRNALDVVGVDAADAYRWSSHRSYLGHRRLPDFLRTERVLTYFDGDPAAFDRFVRTEGVGGRSTDPELLRGIAWLAVGECSGDSATGRQLDRTLLFLLMDHLDETDRRRVMEVLDVSPGPALDSSRSRARRRLAESGDVRRAFDLVRREVGLLDDAA